MTIEKNSIDRVEKAISKIIEGKVRKVAVNFWDLINENVKTPPKLGSPVFSSRYIRSHRINLDKPDISTHRKILVTTGKDADFNPEHQGQENSIAQNEMKNYKFGQNVFITNSVPYAKKLEKGLRARFFVRDIASEENIRSPKTPNGIYGPVRRFVAR